MVTNQKQESAEPEKNLNKVIKINEGRIQSHLDQMVRSTVEQTLNELLDAEADQLCNARRYERSEQRTDQRAGHYTRMLHTKASPVELKVPKLQKSHFRDGYHRAIQAS